MMKIYIKMRMNMCGRLISRPCLIFFRSNQQSFTIALLAHRLCNIYQAAMQVVEIMSVLRHKEG